MEVPFALDYRVSQTFELSNTSHIGAVFPDAYTAYSELFSNLEAPLSAVLDTDRGAPPAHQDRRGRRACE